MVLAEVCEHAHHHLADPVAKRRVRPGEGVEQELEPALGLTRVEGGHFAILGLPLLPLLEALRDHAVVAR